MQRLGFVLFHALAQMVSVAHNLTILKPRVGERWRSKADGADTASLTCRKSLSPVIWLFQALLPGIGGTMGL